MSSSFMQHSHESTRTEDQLVGDESDNHDDNENNANATAGADISLLSTHLTQAVRRMRYLTLLVMIIATVIIVGVYLFTRREEEDDFEKGFLSNGLKVLDSFQSGSSQKLLALSTLSSTWTAFAVDHNMTWPFVTMPQSSYHVMEPYLNLADAASITLMPIVPAQARDEWQAYAVEQQGWVDEYLAADNAEEQERLQATNNSSQQPITPFIKNYVGIDTSPGPWVVWWQYAPIIPNRYFINFNMRARQGFDAIMSSVRRGQVVLGFSETFVPGLDLQSTQDFTFTEELLQVGGNRYSPGEPLGNIFYPVMDSFGPNAKTGAILNALEYWKTYFENLLPDNVNGVVVVVHNSAGQAFSYRIDGPTATYLGSGDHHDPTYNHLRLEAKYLDTVDQQNSFYDGASVDTEYLDYWIQVYPSAQMRAEYLTNTPWIYTSIMLTVFLVTAILFLSYDRFVQRRQNYVMTSALASNAVLDSIFPQTIKERVMRDAHNHDNTATNGGGGGGGGGESSKKLSRSDSIPNDTSTLSSMPIADFFPNATIMFADIRGFTAWCSTREPAQVFTLLETIYNAFDVHAKKRRVFKVETVGDCYVAAAGVPTPRADHAVVMARFACDCALTFQELVHKLNRTLGPDTSDLSIRFGLHSGAVTGGVIRGENARFQLFGDTVNTAARMESTSEGGCIQISQDTANLLVASGKKNWFKPRQTMVFAKGKGEMQTHWLKLGSHDDLPSICDASHGAIETGDLVESDGENRDKQGSDYSAHKTDGLVQWNVDLLLNLMKKIVAHRRASHSAQVVITSPAMLKSAEQRCSPTGDLRTIDEVKEIVKLPNSQATAATGTIEDYRDVVIDPKVVAQLTTYIQHIAAMYNDNPFHNFEHASHVTMSVNKLLSRIIEPSTTRGSAVDDEKSLHAYTYGLTSDPLTHFACVFSAVIHDVQHTGVPNAQLVQEGDDLASFYSNKSVAEQNSIDVSWTLLLEDSFQDLRSTLYCNESEMLRFRQLVVNSVMATDIVDKDLKTLRNARWDRAFWTNGGNQKEQTQDQDAVNRKATIVIEHLIQASDVSHTMQHWHIYRKWNERFFLECYQAYKNNRAGKDPSEGWYEGELGFFDYYIIPLARKLKDCGVFGVSSDEYLNYAMENRSEWKLRGREVVSEMLEKALQLRQESCPVGRSEYDV